MEQTQTHSNAGPQILDASSAESEINLKRYLDWLKGRWRIKGCRHDSLNRKKKERRAKNKNARHERRRQRLQKN